MSILRMILRSLEFIDFLNSGIKLSIGEKNYVISLYHYYNVTMELEN